MALFGFGTEKKMNSFGSVGDYNDSLVSESEEEENISMTPIGSVGDCDDFPLVSESEEEENISTPMSGKTLKESLRNAFDNEICTDVTFIVGPESTPIKSHKLILISRSSVFKAMFDGPLAEKGDIKIEDADEEHFKKFLRFLYTDSVVLTADCVASLVYLAEKYEIDLLKKKCEEFLKVILQTDNACKTLEIANTYNMTSLRKVCLDIIGLESEECLESESFLEVNGETVDLITESEVLNCPEERIFEALDRWAGEECNKKKMEVNSMNKKNIAHKYLKNIRFPLMSHQYLIHEMVKHKYLTQGEIFGILNEDPQNTNFSSNPRLGFKGNVVVRFENGTIDLECSVGGGEVNAISFKVSHHSWLYGALVYGSPREQRAIVELRVTRSNGAESNIAGVKRNIEVGAGIPVHTILFEAPVYIPAIKEHSIYLGLFGSNTTEFYRKPITSNLKQQNNIFGSVKRKTSNARVTHKSDAIENAVVVLPETQADTSVTRSFRHKTITFFNNSLGCNKSCVRSGQLPGLLLF